MSKREGLRQQFPTALITGGAGFIGLQLVSKLVRDGFKTTVFDNLLPQVHGGVYPSFPAGVDFVHGDVRDSAAVTRAVEETQPDAVVHLAAETGTGQSWDEVSRYCNVNVSGTAHLIESIRRLPPADSGPRRLILASSRAVYGEGAYHDEKGAIVVPPVRSSVELARGRFAPCIEGGATLRPIPTPETTPPSPASIYASTKLMQEHIVLQGLDGSTVVPTILRFQNVYGPGQSLHNPYTGVLSIFSEQILAGKTLQIYEDGEIVRDFVFVEDVVDAILASLSCEAPTAGPINIGSGAPASIIDVARTLLRLYGRSEANLVVTGAFRAGDVRFAVADVSRAAAVLGWEPRTSLDAGLERLASWVRATHERA